MTPQELKAIQAELKMNNRQLADSLGISERIVEEYRSGRIAIRQVVAMALLQLKQMTLRPAATPEQISAARRYFPAEDIVIDDDAITSVVSEGMVWVQAWVFVGTGAYRDGL